MSNIQFEDIDYYNDGVTVDIIEEIEQTIFVATDLGGAEFKISCDKLIREDIFSLPSTNGAYTVLNGWVKSAAIEKYITWSLLLHQ